MNPRNILRENMKPFPGIGLTASQVRDEMMVNIKVDPEKLNHHGTASGARRRSSGIASTSILSEMGHSHAPGPAYGIRPKDLLKEARRPRTTRCTASASAELALRAAIDDYSTQERQ
jgi:hypothetical protein